MNCGFVEFYAHVYVCINIQLAALKPSIWFTELSLLSIITYQGYAPQPNKSVVFIVENMSSDSEGGEIGLIWTLLHIEIISLLSRWTKWNGTRSIQMDFLSHRHM